VRLHYWRTALLDNIITKNFLESQFKGKTYKGLVADLKDITLGFKGPIKNLPSDLKEDEVANIKQFIVDLRRTDTPLLVNRNGKDGQSGIPLPPVKQVAALKVLFALCCRTHPDISYCQGMNYFAVLFLALNKDDEEAAYMMFLGLIISKQLIGMYGDKLREFHVKNYVHKEILKRCLPQRLWVHLTKKLGLNVEMITT